VSVLRSIIAGWEEVTTTSGETVANVFRLLDENMQASHVHHGGMGYQPIRFLTLRNAIAELSGKPIGVLPSPRSFAMRLNKLRNRVVDGKRMTSEMNHSKVQVWKVEHIGKEESGNLSGTKGLSGTISQPYAGEFERTLFSDSTHS